MPTTSEVAMSREAHRGHQEERQEPHHTYKSTAEVVDTRATSSKPIQGAAVLRAVACIIAAYTAWVGQGILTGFAFDPQWARGLQQVERYHLGLALSLGAALVFGLAVPSLPWSSRVSGVVAGVRVRLFARDRFAFRALIYALVLMSLGLCRYSNLVHKATYSDPALPAKYPWWLSIAIFCVAVLAIRRLEKGGASFESSPRFSGWNYLCVALLTLGAAAIRFYDIVGTPVAVNMDNTEALGVASARAHPLFWLVPGLGVYGIPAVSLLFLKISVWFHGSDIFGLRAPEAVLGTLMVLGSYLFVWRSFDSHRLATLTAALLAAHGAHIHFSRHIMNLDPWTFVVFGFFFLVHGIRSQRVWAFAAAGITLAFSLQLYLAVRVLLFVAPLFVWYLVLHHRAVITRMWDGWLLFICGVAVMVGPNLADMLLWRDAWMSSNRASASFLNIQTLYDASKAHNLPTVMSFVEFQVRRILLTPQVMTDTSGQMHTSAPLFDLLIAPFFWLGLGVALASWRKSPAMVLTVLVCAMIELFGQGLFSNVPYWPKLIFIMFAGCLWAAIGILGLCRSCAVVVLWATQRLGSFGPRVIACSRVVLAVCLAALVIFVGQRQWSAYALSSRRDASQIDLAGRFIYRLPQDAIVCGVRSTFDTYMGRAELPFFAQGRTLKELGPRPAVEVADQCGPRPFGWIVMPDQVELKDKLVALYPDGELKSYQHKYGQHLLWTFYVP